MIHIINKKTFKREPNQIYFSVDRSSPLGNPFFMSSESQRDAVCDQYETYFYQMLAENVNKPFIEALYKIIKAHLSGADVYLACWCAPKRCHAETIKRFAESAHMNKDEIIIISIDPLKPIKIVFEKEAPHDN